jgi:DNA-binding transcriptional LysR family regulator
VELKWLEDLLVLLDERSISRAAARRHVTQPAYSRRIRQLEQWLDVELVDRSTKPIKIRASALALEDGVRDLVNGFYALRNSVHETPERVTFVAQHTLAIARFPALIRGVKESLPQASYRVVPANYEECEALFYGEADLLLCYQSAQRSFDFSHMAARRLDLGSDRLLPVMSPGLAQQLGSLAPGMAIPLLMYQPNSFFAEALGATCLPRVIRDYRIEIICESAFSASLKEMALEDMGIAWLAQEIIDTELASGRLLSCADELGEVELDIVLHYRDELQAVQVGEVIAAMTGHRDGLARISHQGAG